MAGGVESAHFGIFNRFPMGGLVDKINYTSCKGLVAENKAPVSAHTDTGASPIFPILPQEKVSSPPAAEHHQKACATQQAGKGRWFWDSGDVPQ